MGYIVDAEFWGNRLSVNLEEVSKQVADPVFMAAFVEGLSSRCRTILEKHFKLSFVLGAKAVKESILGLGDKLTPFVLAQTFMAQKATFSIMEVARAELTAREMEACRIKDENHERLAVLWSLYLKNPRNLETVFYSHLAQKRGYARLVLISRPKGPGAEPAEFFTPTVLQELLDGFEEETRSRRKSYCAQVTTDGDCFRAFIKRDDHPASVSKGKDNYFGYQPDWMVVQFDRDLARVQVSSLSPDVPLLLANRIANRFFAVNDLKYENETIATPAEKIWAFLRAVQQEKTEAPLLEATFENVGLSGSPQMRLNDKRDRSIAAAIEQFTGVFGDPFARLENLESLKVKMFGKRVKLILEPQKEPDMFVVRYADQPLTLSQRRGFENYMDSKHGIIVLSTEKRHAD
jgi:hypothetical protein